MVKRAFMWATIVSLAASGLVGIAVLLLPRMRFTGEVLWSTATVGLYSLLATICAIVIERSKRASDYRVLGVVGIGASVFATGVILIQIWAEWILDGVAAEDVRVKSVVTATCLGVVCAHVGLYAPARLLGVGRVLKMVTVGAGVVFGVLLSVVIWAELDEDWVGRGMGALGILVVMGSAITPIVWKMQSLRRRAHATPSLRKGFTIRLACPRCGMEQAVAVGEGKCARCKLEIRVEVEEPRCVCGYELLGLKGARCPECGREIPEGDRWAVVGEEKA